MRLSTFANFSHVRRKVWVGFLFLGGDVRFGGFSKGLIFTGKFPGGMFGRVCAGVNFAEEFVIC